MVWLWCCAATPAGPSGPDRVCCVCQRLCNGASRTPSGTERMYCRPCYWERVWEQEEALIRARRLAYLTAESAQT